MKYFITYINKCILLLLFTNICTYLYVPASDNFVAFIYRTPGGTIIYLLLKYKNFNYNKMNWIINFYQRITYFKLFWLGNNIFSLCCHVILGKGTLSIKQDNLVISPSCTVIFSGDSLNI